MTFLKKKMPILKMCSNIIELCSFSMRNLQKHTNTLEDKILISLTTGEGQLGILTTVAKSLCWCHSFKFLGYCFGGA